MSRLENSDCSFDLCCSNLIRVELTRPSFYLVSSLAPNSTLLGSSPQESALVDQWIAFAATEISTQTFFTRVLCRSEVAGNFNPYNKNVR